MNNNNNSHIGTLRRNGMAQQQNGTPSSRQRGDFCWTVPMDPARTSPPSHPRRSSGFLVRTPSNPLGKEQQQNGPEIVPLLIQLTGLYYLGSRYALLKVLRILLAAALCAFVTYQTMTMLVTAILDGSYSVQTAHTMINFNWLLQAEISMIFLLYWQVKGLLPDLFRMMSRFEGYSQRWMHPFAAVSYGLLFMMDITVVVVILLLYHTMGTREQEHPSDGNRIIQVYGRTLLHDKLFIVIHYYTRFVWLVVLVVFISVTSVIHHRFREANRRLCAFGASEPRDPGAFGDALNGQLMEHTELARWIRSVDRVFGVYTFLMVCLNIPVFIFSLSMLLLTLPSQPQWVHIVVPLVDILFSLCELMGLTIIPAKIHTRIHEVEKIIFDNVFIWKNLDTRIYQLANAFIMYANQPSLGITLWGFAVIRKPLILTTISLTATYLTVIIQFHAVGNETCCVYGNGTCVVNGTNASAI